MTLVASHVREEGLRRNLGALEPSAPGLWVNGNAFVRLIAGENGEFDLLFRRLHVDVRSKDYQTIERVLDAPQDVAARIVDHLQIHA